MQGLDKITARVSEFTVRVEEPAAFGDLRIQLRTCMVSPPTEAPDAAGFLQIDELTPAGEEVRQFSGWMFASDPSISAMDHPVYDVWVKDCADTPGAVPADLAATGVEPGAGDARAAADDPALAGRLQVVLVPPSPPKPDTPAGN